MRVSRLAASATAPAALRPPAPCVNASYRRRHRPLASSAVYCSTALTALGVSAGREQRCRTNPTRRVLARLETRATTPLVTAGGHAGAAQLDVLGVDAQRRVAHVERAGGGGERAELACPGATRSGFAKPSYHVGPREL